VLRARRPPQSRTRRPDRRHRCHWSRRSPRCRWCCPGHPAVALPQALRHHRRRRPDPAKVLQPQRVSRVVRSRGPAIGLSCPAPVRRLPPPRERHRYCVE
jgi:hypothetical protein